ncbi:MAG: tyrosine-type recombinase/integrase [Candidatus Hodarchaeota archaeon]
MRSNERIKERYFEDLEQACLAGLAKRTTIAQRRKAVNYFVEFLNRGRIDLKRLESQQIQDFLQYLSQKKTARGGKFAPATIKQIYALARSFYVHYYEKSPRAKHPDRVFTKQLLRRYKLGERKLPKYIDQGKMKQLLEECPDRWKALFHFMYDTGSRISEVLGIQHQHLDLKRKIVQIYEPKTMNVRVTTLSNKTVKLLDEYLSKYRPNPRAGHESYVFVSQQRRKMSSRAVQYIVKQYSAKILGEKNAITPHYFRAACAAHLLESGVDIRQVQEIIGWKSLAVVQNYTRVTPQRQAQLKEKHHPGFQEELAQQKNENKTSLTSDQTDSFQQQITGEQQGYQQELRELRKSVQQEIKELREERRTYEKHYEQRIDELLKSQQQERQAYERQIKEMREVQQQLIQLLSQKSS